VGGTTFIVILKAHVTPGFPQREVELFTLADAINVNVGPYEFNLRPQRLEVLQQDFFLLSALDRGGFNGVRFFWSSAAGAPSQIKYMDVNFQNLHPVVDGAGSTPLFDGIDPFIMDGRVLPTFPNRLYLVYVKADGSNAFRTSSDFGATWGSETIFDPTGGDPPVRIMECNFLDPLTTKENVQVLSSRDT
jgi:hypothetical protein